MGVTHIVLFQFKASASADTVKDDGITHAFVVEFENVEDRDYYVNKDPAHLAFVGGLGDAIQKVQVIDFTNGVF
ncbi:hypothetical protein FQN52_004378 [Onygenales sp. PD_12]|nr:hypothetical protein FQN53_004354 [Emmonsiellopsis sp. PD_33]KAK2791936.1 hypothetical protein FQN52_004378 [Onygenales sp. PD_12]